MSETNIKEFQPRQLEDVQDQNKMTVRTYTPTRFGSETTKPYQEIKKTFGSLASTDENANKKFSLHPDSKKYLGVEQEEHSRLELIIQKEVSARVAEITDRAYQEGYANGEREGNEQAQQKMFDEMGSLRVKFEALMTSLEAMKEEMYFANERILIQLIYQVARHVMLKELKQDQEYLKRLCAQLIEKIGIKDQLKIKVSKTDLEAIDQLRDYLKVQYSDLKNVKIEASEEVKLGGCKIESNLIWIDASLESQLKAIEESLKEQ